MFHPGGPHAAAMTTDLTSSTSSTNSMDSNGTSSTDSSGVVGDKAVHPSGGQWLSGG